MKTRIVLTLCTALSVLLTILGTSPPTAALASSASANAVLVNILTNTPNPMLSGQTGTLSLITRQPIQGKVTFTEALSPAPQGWEKPVTVYSCIPSQKPCSMTWAAPPDFVGSATFVATWAGGSTSTVVPVNPSRYLYSGLWHTAQLPPLTQVVPAPTSLTGARPAGQLLGFGTKDPAYACLAGQSLNVFLAPQQFSDDYVVYHPAGAGCPAGAWLFPQQPALLSAPASAGIGKRITLRGTFPDVRPTDPTVQFLGVQREAAPVLTWSTTAIDVMVPQDLLSGRYTLALSWHDPLTGTVVSNAATPVSLQIAGRVLPPIATPNAHVLDRPSLAKLAPLPRGPLAPLTTLRFTGTTTLLQGLKIGDTIVAGASSSAPNGLLRKVTGVTKSATGVSFLTAPATLKDVLKQGSYDVQEPLNAQTVRSVTPLLPGVSYKPAASVGGSFCHDLNNVKLYDDGSGNTVVANGQVCLSGSIGMSGYVSWTSVGASVTVSAGDTAHVNLTGKTSYSFKNEVPLFTDTLAHILFFIGPIPVDIQPQITFSVGAMGHITANVTVGATQQASFTAGAGCHFGLSNGCDAHADASNSFTVDADSFAGNGQTINGYPYLDADVTGYASVKAEAMLYGVVGGGLELQGYVEGVAGTKRDPWWTLYAGLKLNVVFDLHLFGINDHESWNVGDWKTAIDQADGPLAPPTLQLTVSPNTTGQHPAMCTQTTLPNGKKTVQCPTITLRATLTSALGPLQGQVDFSIVSNDTVFQTTKSCTTDGSGTCQATWTPPVPTELTSYTITAHDEEKNPVYSQPVNLWVNTNATPE